MTRQQATWYITAAGYSEPKSSVFRYIQPLSKEEKKSEGEKWNCSWKAHHVVLSPKPAFQIRAHTRERALLVYEDSKYPKSITLWRPSFPKITKRGIGWKEAVYPAGSACPNGVLGPLIWPRGRSSVIAYIEAQHRLTRYLLWSRAQQGTRIRVRRCVYVLLCTMHYIYALILLEILFDDA
jgi:hypothetical protein